MDLPRRQTSPAHLRPAQAASAYRQAWRQGLAAARRLLLGAEAETFHPARAPQKEAPDRPPRQPPRHAATHIDTPDVHGATPLHEAARQGRTEEARELLAAGARLDARDGRNRTALHMVAGAQGLGTLLASRGADLRARDELGRLPDERPSVHWKQLIVREQPAPSADWRLVMAAAVTRGAAAHPAPVRSGPSPGG